MNRILRSFASRAALALALALVITITIVLVRTAAAGKVKAAAPLRYAVPEVDVPAAVNNLSAALRFETISYDDASESEAFARFRAWLVETYPRFHALTERTLVRVGTLVHEWRAEDALLYARAAIAAGEPASAWGALERIAAQAGTDPNAPPPIRGRT